MPSRLRLRRALEPGAPPAANLRYQTGIEMYLRGDFAGAAREFRVGVALAPKSAKLAYNLARSLERAGDVPGAIAEYRRDLSLLPDALDRGEVERVIAVLEGERAKVTPAVAAPSSAPAESTATVGSKAAFSARELSARELAAARPSRGAYAAVRIERSGNVLIEGLRVDNVAGGPGGHTHIGTRGGDGGLGLGLFIADSDGVMISNAHLSGIRAGRVADARPGVPGTAIRGFAGFAGEAIGVFPTRSPGVDVRHLLVHDVTSEIWAFGVVADSIGLGNVIAQATIENISGANRTPEELPPTTNLTAAVLLQGMAGGELRFENAVVADISGIRVIVGLGLSMTRTAVCFRGDRQVFAAGPLSAEGPFWENPSPLFLENTDVPYRLDPGSICVDFGTGPCAREPAPAGVDCLPDVGYEGNSARGQIRQD